MCLTPAALVDPSKPTAVAEGRGRGTSKPHCEEYLYVAGDEGWMISRNITE